ncbi:MAG: site-specific DNA-methyltransferase [Candidatus Eisenbacteria sp.]|nr:site-specific DNA-methyltransferase [Candidatus Eisenbacteria bacterium]
MKSVLTIPMGTLHGLLVHGDNLELLASLPGAIADLIVTDPPFFTDKIRTVPRSTSRTNSNGATEASFDDRWRDLDQYKKFLRIRLEEARRILKTDGSIVLHLDYRVVHDIRTEMDRIFGRRQFINEIIWHYTGGGRSRRYFSRKHDTLLWYAKGKQWTFNIDAVRVPYESSSGYAHSGIVGRNGKRYRPHPLGTPVDDVWDIPIINPLSKERCGFPTQKPEKLLKRILLAMSNEGDLVIDPFCGSGTSVVVAEQLGRRWIACDVTEQAIAITAKRLEEIGAGRRFKTAQLGNSEHTS